MDTLLSRRAQILLVRLFFVVLALGALYSIWDNKDFLTNVPFVLAAIADALFAIFFLYSALLLPKLVLKGIRLPLYTLGAYWAYSLLVSLASVILYTKNIGIGNAAQAENVSVPLYVLLQVNYLVVLPSIAFGLVWWILSCHFTKS